jgi:two-component system response regulator YesN
MGLSERALPPDGQLIIVQGAQSSLIEKALQIIHKEYADKSLGISGISRRLFTSGAYFCVLFKTYTGTTFVNYLTDYRISKAMEIMRNRNIQLQEIADLAGFESGNYFSKVFKKKMGMPPAEYRKQFTKYRP